MYILKHGVGSTKVAMKQKNTKVHANTKSIGRLNIDTTIYITTLKVLFKTAKNVQSTFTILLLLCGVCVCVLILLLLLLLLLGSSM
jgi:hypothetical protein